MMALANSPRLWMTLVLMSMVPTSLPAAAMTSRREKSRETRKPCRQNAMNLAWDRIVLARTARMLRVTSARAVIATDRLLTLERFPVRGVVTTPLRQVIH
ncbi:hypothetical protein PF011_g11300 [Phytophthora fragariae]|uniref:RxLR effector protein n=1 Tax=Phytophthora fragariae TaxID=53985 RepID=A0A6A3KMP9_9STRA|nr:hypothetical protein PF011_g11300 [Phytophthora fragariae]